MWKCITVIFVTQVLAISCAFASNGTPSDVAKSFLNHIASNDADGALSLMSKKQNDEARAGNIEEAKNNLVFHFFDFKRKFERVQITSTTVDRQLIDGDKSDVDIRATLHIKALAEEGGGTLDQTFVYRFHMLKENGQWRVDRVDY